MFDLYSRLRVISACEDPRLGTFVGQILLREMLDNMILDNHLFAVVNLSLTNLRSWSSLTTQLRDVAKSGECIFLDLEASFMSIPHRRHPLTTNRYRSTDAEAYCNRIVVA